MSVGADRSVSGRLVVVLLTTSPSTAGRAVAPASVSVFVDITASITASSSAAERSGENYRDTR